MKECFFFLLSSLVFFSQSFFFKNCKYEYNLQLRAMLDHSASIDNKDVRSMEIEFVRALNAFVNNFPSSSSSSSSLKNGRDQEEKMNSKSEWKTGAKPRVYAESLRRQLNALREKTQEMYLLEKKKKSRKKKKNTLLEVLVGARDDEDEDDEENEENCETDERNQKKEIERKFRAYEERINEIEKKLPAHKHPAFVSATASTIPSSSSCSAAATATAAFENAKSDNGTNIATTTMTTTTTTTTTTTVNIKKKLYAPKKFTISKEGDKMLQKEKKMQENLTDEMVDLASRIKRNAEEVSKELSRSTKLVDSMETKLDQNVVVAKSATHRQTAVFRKNKKYGCWSCVVLTLVFVLFSWVYIVIKFSGDKTVKIIEGIRTEKHEQITEVKHRRDAEKHQREKHRADFEL